MACETRGAGQEGGRDGVGDRGAAEGTLDHCRGRRCQVHGWPGMETLSDKVTGIPPYTTKLHTWNRHQMISYSHLPLSILCGECSWLSSIGEGHPSGVDDAINPHKEQRYS